MVSLRAPNPAVWRRPFELPVDREQLRHRVLAFTGLWFLLAGMLAALGFDIVLFASLFGCALAGGLWLLRRYRMGQRLRAALLSVDRASRKVDVQLAELGLREHFRRFAGTASRRAGALLEVRQGGPPAVDRHRRARRLNELGAQLRREGDHEQAAEKHRIALAIVRELGDRRAEALTLNNLALALVHTGSVSLAVQHFEQALVLLRELGEKEHEGQVIANLGFVRRRQGRDEDAESLLTAALDKLSPESSAYRHVAEQLRRAS
jgi:tetratricopeptide (TPR) repeat protein